MTFFPIVQSRYLYMVGCMGIPNLWANIAEKQSRYKV